MIRRATRADAPVIFSMGQALAQESPKYRDMVLDEAKMMALGDRLQGTLLSELACVFIAEKAGEPIGMMVGVMAERWFSNERYVSDLTLYVKPEHRGGLAFVRLVQAVERWAREQGVPYAAFGVSTEIHPEQTVRAYERLGYTLSGYTLTKKLADHGD